MVGNDGHPFKGTFDGGGHTLTVDMGGNWADRALFYQIEDATIKNLNVAGAITLDRYRAATFAVFVSGNCTIQNCWSNVSVGTVSSYDYNGTRDGGAMVNFVKSGATINITDCAFTGCIYYLGSSRGGGGGMVGWADSGATANLTRCLFAPSNIEFLYTPHYSYYMFVMGSVRGNLNKCYYNATAAASSLIIEGTDASGMNNTQLLAALGSNWQIVGSDLVPKKLTQAISPIVDPVFTHVTLDNSTDAQARQTVSFSGGSFRGTYSPFAAADISDMLFDAHNADNSAFQAALSPIPPTPDSFVGWYTNTALTTPATVIPFDEYGNATLYTKWAVLELSDASDNNGAIMTAAASGINYDRITLSGRTLYRDGDWNTICLPFELSASQITASSLAGAVIKELDGTASNLTDGTLTLKFNDATAIEAGKPYIIRWEVTPDLVINSDGDWNTFAAAVSSGTTYEGQLVQLGADISVSNMVGGTFKGTLDGAGHTITANLSGNGDGTALFREISGATIQNVKVEGTITTSGQRPATFAAFVTGSSTIKNCWSTVDVSSTISNNWVDGGAFVARVNANKTLNISDCAFTGSVAYSSTANEGGGMVGWAQGGATANLTRCLFAPASLTMSNAEDKTYIFVSGAARGNLTDCYYNNTAKGSILQNEGTDASEMSNADLLSALGSNWQESGGKVVPKMTARVHFVTTAPVFSAVTVTATEPTTVSFTGGKFVGTYSPFEVNTSNIDEIIYLGSENIIGYASAPRTLRAFRAHFEVPTSSGARAMTRTVVNFGDGSENTTGIYENLGFNDRNVENEAWYSLDGRRLQGRPTAKGLYIHNGRKEVVR